MTVRRFSRFPDLQTVTFTGVDEATDLDALRALNDRYPQGAIEWGVLFSDSRAGNEGRYPHLSWIDRWAFNESVGMNTALHLCGQAAHAWIAGDDDLRSLARGFSRLQLNVVGPRTDAVALRAALDEGIHPQVLTQHHAGNAALTAALTGAPPITRCSSTRPVAGGSCPPAGPRRCPGWPAGMRAAWGQPRSPPRQLRLPS
jgi:hypothetical protein